MPPSGHESEELALAHLKRAGLKLVARNYRCKAGEIDLVMLDRDVLAIIEVRYRATSGFGGAAASVAWRKQRRIATAAKHLLLTRADLRRHPARFDVVAVSSGSHASEIEWIKDAFTTP